MSTAKTILSQLGGNKFCVMTGVKNLVAEENGIKMKLPRNLSKANHMRVTLNSMDTYDVEWLKVTMPTARNGFNYSEKVVDKQEGIYCDMLQDNFTRVTGLYTSL